MKIFFVFLILSSNLALTQVKYTTTVNTSTLTNDMSNYQMSNQGDNVFVCYKRGTGNSPADNEIKVCISNNKGLSWIEKDITIPNSSTFNPIISSTKSAIIILYKYYDINNNINTCIARSTDNGLTFNLLTNNNSNLAYTINSGDCSITSTNNGKIFVGNSKYLFFSQDNGLTFNAVNVPPNTTNGYTKLCSNDSTLWYTFNVRDTIYAYSSSDNGNTYKLLTKYFAAFNYFNIETCVKNSKLVVVWSEESVGVYYLRMKIIDGTSATNSYDISTSNYAFNWPTIQWKQNNIWVSSYEYNNCKLYYTKDEGKTWSRGSYIDAEFFGNVNYFSHYTNNFYCYDDTTLFYLSGHNVGIGSLINYIFTNIKWTDCPIAEFTNDSLLTSSDIKLNFNSYVEISYVRLEISDKINFSNILIDTTSNISYFNIQLRNRIAGNGTRYYFRIQGIDGTYTTSWSVTKSFRYGSTIITKPLLVLPQNGATINWPNSVSFHWNSVPKADAYVFHLSTSQNFDDTLSYGSTSDTNFSTIPSNGIKFLNGNFYWRIRGAEYQTGTLRPWSAAGNFIYESAPNGIKDQQNNIPDYFFLYQNYPNPFNPTTMIRFALPFRSTVKIDIYSLLGEKIKEIVNGHKNAGYYEVNFNTNGLSSGVYLYMIEAKSIDGKNEYRESKKMILLK